MDEGHKREFQAVYRHPEPMLVALPLTSLSPAGLMTLAISSSASAHFGERIALAAIVTVGILVLAALNAVRGYHRILADTVSTAARRARVLTGAP